MPAECRPTEKRKLQGSERKTPQQGQRKQLELEKGKTFVPPPPIDGVITIARGMTQQFYAFVFRMLQGSFKVFASKVSNSSLPQMLLTFKQTVNRSREENFRGFSFPIHTVLGGGKFVLICTLLHQKRSRGWFRPCYICPPSNPPHEQRDIFSIPSSPLWSNQDYTGEIF